MRYYNGFIDCIRKTFANEGLMGFFHGLPIAILKSLCTILLNYKFNTWLEWLQDNASEVQFVLVNPPIVKILRSIICYPLDTVTKSQQCQKSSGLPPHMTSNYDVGLKNVFLIPAGWNPYAGWYSFVIKPVPAVFITTIFSYIIGEYYSLVNGRPRSGESRE